jgi:hypothetical protein
VLSVTNSSALPGLGEFDTANYEGRRLVREPELPARELVANFGHGRHSCPAQSFSIEAIRHAVAALVARFEVERRFWGPRPLRRQIGGVARADRPPPRQTNENSPSVLNWGLEAGAYTGTIEELTPKTSHDVQLQGLQQATQYHYEIVAVDAAGNLTTTGDQVFSTAAPTNCGLTGGEAVVLLIGLQAMRRRRRARRRP